jgi:hypothetical protein
MTKQHNTKENQFMNIHDAAYIMHGIINPQAAEETKAQQEEEELWRWQQQQECEEREQSENEEFARPRIGRNNISKVVSS